MERFCARTLLENGFAHWAALGLGEKTPNHSYLGDCRKRLGTEKLMAVFNRVRESLKSMGLMRAVLTFVDASHE